MVAPGVNIVGIGNNGNLLNGSGTNFAAPQVSGLAAVLMNRNANLRSWPEAVRAILMASALHNIEGASHIPGGQDLKDGAGGIDAALAVNIARTRSTSTCIGPCWWGDRIDNSNLPVGGSFSRSFQASRGERIRAAIAWWSNADCPDEANCRHDRLDTDLNLTVYGPDGTLVGYSASWDNNYELVEFTAPRTGQYTIGAYKASSSESYNYLGMAWVKDAIYAPDLRNQNGWYSDVYIRNGGPVARNVTIYWFDSNGNPTPRGQDTCALNPNQQCFLPVNLNDRIPSGTTGFAIVDGGEDVTLTVDMVKNSRTEVANYTGVLQNGSSGSLGWEQAGSVLYAPALKHSYAGRSSMLQLANPGPQATYVYVDFYRDDGAVRPTSAYYLPANGTAAIPTTIGAGGGGCDTNGTVCSARIYSNNGQPIVGVVQEYRDGDGLALATDNLSSAGSLSIAFPIVKHQLSNMSTGLHIQNAGLATANVNVYYYRSDGGLACVRSAAIPAYAAAIFYDSSNTCPGTNFLGSVVVNSNQPIVGRANESSADGRYKKGYASFEAGSRAAYAPTVYGGYVRNGSTWDTSIIVQNLGSSGTVDVRVDYYNQNGSWASNQTAVLNYRGSAVFQAPTSSFRGSAVITANQDIAAVVHTRNNAASGDTHAMYNASAR